MDALARPTVTDRLPVWGAMAAAATVGLAFAIVPAIDLEKAIEVNGLGALIPFAAAPLRPAARAVLALGGAVLSAVVIWSALYILFGEGGLLATHVSREDGVPVVRRADAHPDAPPRRPMTAAELAEADEVLDLADALPEPHDDFAIPIDLDTPLSALDPGSIPPVPLEPMRLVAPLAPGERLRAFALARPAAEGVPAPKGIDGLLRRLAAG